MKVVEKPADAMPGRSLGGASGVSGAGSEAGGDEAGLSGVRAHAGPTRRDRAPAAACAVCEEVLSAAAAGICSDRGTGGEPTPAGLFTGSVDCPPSLGAWTAPPPVPVLPPLDCGPPEPTSLPV